MTAFLRPEPPWIAGGALVLLVLLVVAVVWAVTRGE